MKDLIIYKALRMGISITIRLRKYRMEDGDIMVKLSASDNGSQQEVWVLAVWGNQIPFLIELGNRATEEDIQLITADIGLNELKEDK